MLQFRNNSDLLSILVVSLWAHVSAGQTDTEEGRFLLWGKPFLIFPRSSPTRTQFIAGIGIPLKTAESVTTGWVLKTQFFLPSNVSELKPQLWEGWNDTRRSLGKREVEVTIEKLADEVDLGDDEFEDGDYSYWLEEEEAERLQKASEQDAKEAEGYNAEQSRWITYRALEKVGERYGAGGRPCVLRSICDTAAAEFTYTGGVFAELLHIIFTPSTTTETLSEHNDNEYYRAEQLGREGAPCERVFHECKQSILDLFTGVHDPVTNTLLTRHDIVQAIMKQAQ